MEKEQKICKEGLENIKKLKAGKMSRKEVSNWATSLLIDDDLYIENEKLYSALELIGGLDLVSTDRPYLFEQKDINKCLEDLKRVARKYC